MSKRKSNAHGSKFRKNTSTSMPLDLAVFPEKILDGRTRANFLMPQF